MKPASDPVELAIEYTLKQDRGRLIAALYGAIGDFELAEESLQEAAIAALSDWRINGIPKSRRGWVLQVARRRALDGLRRAQNFETKAAQIKILEAKPEPEHFDIPDHRLRLIFTCCHPALDQKTRVALTLRTLGGLTTEEIARAFLDKPATMGQRLARARGKIKKARIPFVIPDAEALPERINSVLNVIYLIFNEGYAATTGKGQIRVDLCEEALFLARLMQDFCPENGEVSGLLALILLSHARKDARFGENLTYIPLSSQDRSLWNQALIRRGKTLLERALSQGQVGVYQLQAAISALHCDAESHEKTDWAQITALYQLMDRIAPDAIVKLNLAVAVSFAETPEKALKLLDNIKSDLDKYQPFHAARADIYRRVGDKIRAHAAYEQALKLTRIESERLYLEHQKQTV